VKSKKRKSDGSHTEISTEKVKNLQPKTTEQPQPAGSGKDKKGKLRKESKVFKSAEIIETSDEEEDTLAASPSVSRSKVKKTAAKAGLSPNQRKAMASSSDPGPGGPHPASHSKAKSGRVDADIQDNTTAKAGSASQKRPVKLKNESGDNSESDMSVDATPVKKKSKKGHRVQEDAKNEVKVKKSKKAGLDSSKHDDTVKRLKSLVHACGVRKVWSKEFQNLDKPLQQIKRLKEILAELGMDGRPSMEKAKAIKEKRDLAKELEDVHAFEQSVIGQPSRTPRTKSGTGKQTVEPGSEDHDGSEEHSRDSPPNQRNAARRSIMAFLGDDSDDE